MDYRFFEGLTSQDAEDYLSAFMRAGRERVSPEWWTRMRSEGTAAVVPYFADQAQAIRVGQVAPPPQTPDFIVEAMERDHGGFRDFADDESRGRVLGAAFFLGSAFIQSFDSLAWGVGQEGVAETGQPVVTGFRTGADLPVLVVAENMLLDFDQAQAATAVAVWTRVV